MVEGDLKSGRQENACESSYDEDYYRDHLGALPYHRQEQHWLDFFGAVADRIVTDIDPGTCLDVGCAVGLLAEALVDREVDAHGIDVSEFAITQVRSDLSDRFRVGSILDPIPRRYDLITCVEVLEHLPPADVERAVANLCAASDDILLSTQPNDLAEETHINVRDPDYWAELFARHGFYRDTAYDASYLTYWAVRFRRTTEPMHRIIAGYERNLWRLTREKGERDPIMIRQMNELAAVRAEYESAMNALTPTRQALEDTQGRLEETQGALEETRLRLNRESEKLSRARDQARKLRLRNAELRGEVAGLRRSLTNRVLNRIGKRRRT